MAPALAAVEARVQAFLRRELQALAARWPGATAAGRRPLPIRADFLEMVSALMGSAPWTAAELLDEARMGTDVEHARLRAVLTDMDMPNQRRLGTYLGHRVGSVAGGLEVQKRSKRASGEAVWAVMVAEAEVTTR